MKTGTDHPWDQNYARKLYSVCFQTKTSLFGLCWGKTVERRSWGIYKLYSSELDDYINKILWYYIDKYKINVQITLKERCIRSKWKVMTWTCVKQDLSISDHWVLLKEMVLGVSEKSYVLWEIIKLSDNTTCLFQMIQDDKAKSWENPNTTLMNTCSSIKLITGYVRSHFILDAEYRYIIINIYDWLLSLIVM
jgi:hypothetical protein